jgi:hypothetical protein
MMGLGQGNRAAPPSWIQLSVVLVKVFKQLKLGAIINDPISKTLIHSMEVLFMDDSDIYTLRENISNPGELRKQAWIEIKQWSGLPNATGGALNPEKCWWCLLDYTCIDGEWTYTDIAPREQLITNPDGTKSPIKQEEVTVSKKTIGIQNSPAGGNEGHLVYIKDKVTQWVTQMANNHLPSHIAWVAYKHQLWSGLRYGLGTMTNDLEPAKILLDWRNPPVATLLTYTYVLAERKECTKDTFCERITRILHAGWGLYFGYSVFPGVMLASLMHSPESLFPDLQQLPLALDLNTTITMIE